MSKVTSKELKELLTYDLETGLFTWLVDRGSNKVKGKIAGSDKDGYINISIGKRCYRAHSLAWLYVHGYLPDELDHHNRNKKDNRIDNLRLTNRFKNCQNRGLASVNKSGCAGVSQIKRSKKWIAQITVNRQVHYLGCFADLSEAIVARKNAEMKYNFGVQNA